MSKLVLPVVVIWEDVVFPDTQKELILEDEFNIAACELAVKEYDGKVIVLTTRKEDNREVSLDNTLEIGVICSLESLSEDRSSGGDVCRVKVTGHNRVQMRSVDEYVDAGCWMGKFRTVKTRKTRYDKHKTLLLEFVSRRRDGTETVVSSKIKEFLKTIRDSGGDVEIAVDRLINGFPSSKEGVLQFKKDVLCEPVLFKRIRRVLTLQLGFDVDIVEEEISDFEQQLDQKISKKVNKNINKQQKEFYLREKIKVIKEELGEVSSKEVELRKLREKVKKGHFPKHISAKAKEEIQRFELCSSYSNESTVIRSYLD